MEKYGINFHYQYYHSVPQTYIPAQMVSQSSTKLQHKDAETKKLFYQSSNVFIRAIVCHLELLLSQSIVDLIW